GDEAVARQLAERTGEDRRDGLGVDGRGKALGHAEQSVCLTQGTVARRAGVGAKAVRVGECVGADIHAAKRGPGQASFRINAARPRPCITRPSDARTGGRVPSMDFETRAIHDGQEPDPATGAIIVPIYQTSTYVQEEVGVNRGYDYSRAANPTRTALEIA